MGAGVRFLSAITYYTIRLTNALAEAYPVAAVPMRQLIPTFLYPGRSRVGAIQTSLRYAPSVTLLHGVDWYWVPNLVRDLRAIRRWKPDVVIFQWWTGTVLHSYLAIAVMAKLLRASIIVEFHEALDSGEERIPLARAWVRVLGIPFFWMASAFVIHSESDRALVSSRYGVGARPCVVIPLGPFDHHASTPPGHDQEGTRRRVAPPEALNILFFGLIRPYKGLEDLVTAFDLLDPDEVGGYWLTVVGETWEGWDFPIKLIEGSPYRHRITLVNRFVDDDEVVEQFAAADAVVLPYHRSSASAPAHVAMSNGLPLVITAVGGLPEAVADYEGAILIPPHDPPALRDAIRELPPLRGRRYRDPHTWKRTRHRYERLIAELRTRSPIT